MTTIQPEPPGPPSDGDDKRPPAPPSAPGGSSDPAPRQLGPPRAHARLWLHATGAARGGHGAAAARLCRLPAASPPSWPKCPRRRLIDFVRPCTLAGLIYRGSTALGTILWLAALAWALYNGYLGGQTGQCYGKRIAGTRLLLEATGQPPGGGLGDRALLPAHPRLDPVLRRLPLAAVGLQEADLRRQDRQDPRGH